MELTMLVELHNASDKAVEGKLEAEIPGLNLRVEQPQLLAAGETKSVKLIPQDFGQLVVKEAKLWWPAQASQRLAIDAKALAAYDAFERSAYQLVSAERY